MGFNPTCFDLDVWISMSKVGYDYIGTHTDDVLVIAAKPNYIFNKLKEQYTIKDFGPTNGHLGCDYSQIKKGVST